MANNDLSSSCNSSQYLTNNLLFLVLISAAMFYFRHFLFANSDNSILFSLLKFYLLSLLSVTSKSGYRFFFLRGLKKLASSFEMHFFLICTLENPDYCYSDMCNVLFGVMIWHSSAQVHARSQSGSSMDSPEGQQQEWSVCRLTQFQF